MATKNPVNQEDLAKTDLEKPEQAKAEQAKPEREKPATQVENVATAEKGEKTGETVAPINPISPISPEGPQALAALAATHRVPAWQQAALTRLMGWEADKMVTDGEFYAALTALDNRKQGGGRR